MSYRRGDYRKARQGAFGTRIRRSKPKPAPAAKAVGIIGAYKNEQGRTFYRPLNPIAKHVASAEGGTEVITPKAMAFIAATGAISFETLYVEDQPELNEALARIEHRNEIANNGGAL